MKTWVEIDQKAITHNIRALKKCLPKKTNFLAVVKGNAYGHGMNHVAKMAVKSGANYLGVFDFEEALVLRQNIIKTPILVLRSIDPSQISSAIKLNIDVCVSTFEMLSFLKKIKLSKPLRVHVVVDTGLGRDGFKATDVHAVIDLLKDNKNINVVGLMTHFSGAESREFDAYTKMQIDWLTQWNRHFRDAGMKPMLHASATAGVFISPDFSLDMVRFGIGIYGLWPSTETSDLAKNKTELIPALSWKTTVQEVKKLSAGSYIGYDLTHELVSDSVVAVIPVGYADGYPRSASSRGFVSIKGKNAPILGRVMMNMFVVDVTNIKGVKLGDTVTLIGHDKLNQISAEDLASWAETINYEIVTRINPLIPRILK